MEAVTFCKHRRDPADCIQCAADCAISDGFRAGQEEMRERAAKWHDAKAQDIVNDHARMEADTGAVVFDSDFAQGSVIVHEDSADAIRALAVKDKP